MVYKNINGEKWKSTVIKKLLSFCDKSPVLLSVQTGLFEGKDGVFITHQSTGTKYFFPWDFDKDPKDFIHDIKDFLVPRHYPLLLEKIYEKHELTPLELAELVEKGASMDNLPAVEMRVSDRKLWRIDKVIVWKDIFILQQVDMQTGKPVGNQYRYKYNNLAITYMKDYRSGAFKDLEEAGDTFFKNAILVNEIVPQGDAK